MPISPPKPKSGDYKLAPAGNHLAVCYGVLDIGTHDGEYQGKPKNNRMLMLRFELSDESMDDGRPFSVNRSFNFSTHENASLRKFLNPWVGPFTDESAQAFDYESLAGRACMLTVVHGAGKDRDYANVEAASPLPKRIAAPDQINPTILYTVDDGPPPADFPDWLKDKIAECHEFRGSTRGHEPSARPSGGGQNYGPAPDHVPPATTPASQDDEDSDIPF